MYKIELIWNREFHWNVYKFNDDLEIAKQMAIDIRDSGDGARVKDIRIMNCETGKIVWNG